MRKSIRLPRAKRIRRSPPGSAPGVINPPDDALKPSVKCFVYDKDSIEEKTLTMVNEIRSVYESNPDKVMWFDIKGFGNKLFLEQLADLFNIHLLQMEDVVNVYQRPKAEEYTGHIFFISRVLSEGAGVLVNDQLSMFLGRNFVITLQDKYEDKFDAIINRLRMGKGYLRKSGSDYLAYSIMDLIVDNYYPILEKLGDYLDDLQEELIGEPNRESLNKILLKKRDLIILRRIIWAERDKFNDILRSDFTEINESTKVFIRDSYDHCIQLLDLVENYKEVTASLMDVYHSSVSNRMNGIMKVLTIISTIFIPLTFIVGLYGMNFSRHDPDTGAVLKYNMPELYSPHGYLAVCVVMLLIVIAQIVFFYKKGWLTKQ
jgi:magnesium transporter